MRPKKYPAIAISQVDDPKLYWQLYYKHAVKPHRKPKEDITTKIIYQCPFCQKSSSQGCFDKPFKSRIGLLFYRGRANIQFRNAIHLHQIYESKIQDFLKHISRRAVAFLNKSIEGGIITKKEVCSLLNLNEIKKLEEVEGLWLPKKLGSVQNSMSGANVLNGQQLMVSPSYLSTKKLRNVTPNLLRKPEIS